MAQWWRNGLRAILVVLAVAAVGAVAGCGGGGDDDGGNYDFSGTWTMTSVVVQSNLPGFPVGTAGTDIAKVSQSGTAIVVVVQGVAPQSGTCDPGAGTFAVSGVDDGVVIATNGTAVDENTMSGEWTMTSGPYLARATYTAELVSRNLAAGAQTAKAGLAAKAVEILK